jgi:hypothetical protein
LLKHTVLLLPQQNKLSLEVQQLVLKISWNLLTDGWIFSPQVTVLHSA